MQKQKNSGIAAQLIRFCLPLILSGILQQLYSWADAFIVGNVEGETALAAVGSVGSAVSLLTMAITGFTSGISILAAQKYGGKLYDFIPKILSTFSVLLGVLFLVLSLGGILLSDTLLRLLETPAEITEPAGQYLSIVFFGVPFLAVYNTFSAVIRGVGDSRLPFLSILVSSIANVILDILFVSFFHWGVPGAAFATVLSQASMTLFLIFRGIHKHPLIRPAKGTGLFHKTALIEGIRLGIPPTVQSCITSAGNMVLQGFMNSFGTQTVAAITTAYRVDSIILLPIINLGSGISTIVAQNHGAGDHQASHRVLNVGTVLMTAISVVLTVVVITAGGPTIRLFGVSEEAVSIGAEFFRNLGMFYVVYGLATAFRGYVEGTGDTLFASITGILTLFVRIAGSFAFRSVWGNMVIAWAEVISWVFLTLMLFCRCLRNRKKYT